MGTKADELEDRLIDFAVRVIRLAFDRNRLTVSRRRTRFELSVATARTPSATGRRKPNEFRQLAMVAFTDAWMRDLVGWEDLSFVIFHLSFVI